MSVENVKDELQRSSGYTVNDLEEDLQRIELSDDTCRYDRGATVLDTMEALNLFYDEHEERTPVTVQRSDYSALQAVMDAAAENDLLERETAVADISDDWEDDELYHDVTFYRFDEADYSK